MSSMGRALVVAVLLFLSSFQAPTAYAVPTGRDKKGTAPADGSNVLNEALGEDCENLLKDTFLAEDIHQESLGQIEEELAVRAERRPLTDLLLSDNSKNLVLQAPFMVMNAAQRVGVLVRSAGVDTVQISGMPHNIVVYNIISQGINGQRVIGQEASIEAMINTVDAQAMGDRSAASIPLQVGTHGSGKSATIQVLREAFYLGTRSKNSPYAVWSYEWTGLDKISRVVQRNPRVSETNGVLPAAQNDSPVLLLPNDLRDQLVERAHPVVLEMTKGRQKAMPFLELNPQDKEIRAQLLLHYRALAGRDLTSREVVQVLAKHVQLRRVVWDDSSGALPVIDAQGDDADIAGIFLTPNPIMRVTRGAADTFSWEPGKMMGGHGNAVFEDEILRNGVDFLKLKLRVFQERKVQVGGSPDFPLDTVFLAASNTSSLNKLLEDPDMHALVDRFQLLEMPWPTNPSQIAQVLLHNYSKHLSMIRLPGMESGAEEFGPIEKVDMAKLYPRNAVASANASGPDYRYKLILPHGSREVKFAPHSLRLMSYIVAATRMITDANRAKEAMPFSKVVVSQIFRSPIARIRFEEGLMPDVTNGEIEDLRKISRLLDEGASGVSSRDAGRWLSQVVAEAQRDENRNTVTPDLVFKVFSDMLGKKIKTPDNKTRLEWQSLANSVSTQLIVPLIDQDVNLAMATDQASIRAAYYDIFDELTAQYRDPEAKMYRSRATNEEKSIDFERLQIVKRLFLQSQGRSLDTAQIAMYHESMRTSHSSENDVMHTGLLTAISSYYANLTSRLVSVSDLARFAENGEGNQEVRSQFNTIVKNMARIGYDEASAIAALRFKGRLQALRDQVPNRQ